jgi:hypothetical protein
MQRDQVLLLQPAAAQGTSAKVSSSISFLHLVSEVNTFLAGMDKAGVGLSL